MKTILKELDAVLEQIDFPEGFLENYDQLECLAHGHGTETFLVQSKDGRRKYIAKCYDRGVFESVRESDILKSLRREGLPVFVDEYQNEDFVCVVREFMEGVPLDQYMDGRRLPPQRAVSMCLSLCDLLTYLHTQKPQVIHRDIKPQNLIVQRNGDVALIDFDIARTYENDAERDTQLMGTRAYAPPEQYGFTQTDCRADIYSLGVLLCYMLTGNTDLKNAKIENKRLAAVVRRCTAFAPEQRYASAEEVKRALLRAGGGRAMRIARACAACVVALALLGAGFALGRYTDLLRPPAAIEPVAFAEPLMEKAVHAQLHKPEGEPITKDELNGVRAVYMFGTEVSDVQETFLSGMNGWTLPRGSLTSLEDVALMPNLEVLYVNYQPLSDLSPVATLKQLRYLDVRHTYVSDLSPLVGLPALENIMLFDTNVADLSPLAGCPQINCLELGQTLIDSIEDIPDLKGLRRLSLRGRALQNLNGVERFVRLEWLCLSGTGIKDLSPLLSLPGLQQVAVDESMRGAAQKLGETRFEVQFE